MNVLTKIAIVIATAVLVLTISFIVALFLTDIILQYIHKK